MERGSGSIIIPVHNEATILHQNISILSEYLHQNLDDHEIILIENGSTDDTKQIIHALSLEFKDVTALNLPKASLGNAIKHGIKNAIHNKVVYYPMDLSVNLDYIPESIKELDKYDIIVGSKRLKDGKDRRPIQRKVTSICFHWLVKRLFGTHLSDTTCVKAYRKPIIVELINLVPPDSNVFETEILVEAQKMGLTLKEIPVSVTENRSSRQPLPIKVQLKLKDLLSVRIDIISLYLGVPLLLVGLIALARLSLEKIILNRVGFINPYSFLLSMLLIISGFQIVAFGFLANLVLQIRKEVTWKQSSLDEIREFYTFDQLTKET
jgi:glycosyltransferase involved in cell wall biosynthesis